MFFLPHYSCALLYEPTTVTVLLLHCVWWGSRRFKTAKVPFLVNAGREVGSRKKEGHKIPAKRGGRSREPGKAATKLSPPEEKSPLLSNPPLFSPFAKLFLSPKEIFFSSLSLSPPTVRRKDGQASKEEMRLRQPVAPSVRHTSLSVHHL